MVNLCELPAELIIDILAALEWRSLLACRQVCQLLNTVVKDAAALQYKIELAIAAMEDGPPGAMPPFDRLKCLRRHQAAWDTLRPSSEKDLPGPLMEDEVWELYGGVLAHIRGLRSLAFWQLPSDLRGIQEKHWQLEDVGVNICDFGMDPSQDLLLIFEMSQVLSDRTCRIHLRSLLTGQLHPAAPSPAILLYDPDFGHYDSFIVSISAQFVGTLFQRTGRYEDVLIIWNWHTGATEMVLLVQDQVTSFAFLSDRHLLLPIAGDDSFERFPRLAIDEHSRIGPTVFVVDFLDAPNQPTHISDMYFECALRFPILDRRATAFALSMRSDPAPLWTPGSDLQVPFYTARKNRLFVLTFHVAEEGSPSVMLLLPASTVQACCARSKKRACISWDDWGKLGTRMIPVPRGFSAVWVCHVYGTKFVVALQSPDAEEPVQIQVYDFNQLAIKKSIADGYQNDRENDERKKILLEDAVMPATIAFHENIATSLPCVCRRLYLTAKGREQLQGVMISEDTIIAVYTGPRLHKYRLLTF